MRLKNKRVSVKSDILSENDLRLIGLALIEPIISYEIIGWRGSFDNVISRLHTSQNLLICVGLKNI